MFYHSDGNCYSLFQFNLIYFNFILFLFYFAFILLASDRNSLQEDSTVLREKLMC